MSEQKAYAHNSNNNALTPQRTIDPSSRGILGAVNTENELAMRCNAQKARQSFIMSSYDS